MLKRIILPLFVLTVSAQLIIPGKMIFDQEQILAHGKEFKFKTAPVDPNDPFRGKYIDLRFKENTLGVSNYGDWKKGQEIFVVIKENQEGFAIPLRVWIKEPSNEKHYLSAKIQSVKATKDEYNQLTGTEIRIQYPFERFYMEESKAKAAEDIYRKSNRDEKSLTYALVNIKKGKASLKDVMIDGVSIKELVDKDQN